MASVFVYWALLERVARTVPLMPPFLDDARVRYLALAAGVVMLVLGSILRRTLSALDGASLAALQTGSIVALACCETVATGGVAAFFLTARLDAAYPSLVLALAGFALFFPRRSQWEARALGAAPR